MTSVLLVNSPSHEPGKVLNKLGRWIPGEQLGLCYLAAVLRNAGHRVEIWDSFMGGLSATELSRRVHERINEFDVVGLSVSDGKVHGCVMTLALLSDLPRRVHLTMGGHTATLCAREFLGEFPRVDSVVRGEGEIPLAALCDALSKGEDWTRVPGLSVRTSDGAVQSNRMPRLSHDLDQLPFPSRDNLRSCVESGFAVSVETSRGCKGVCTFCATRMMYQPATGRIWRARTVNNVLAEVELIIAEHGVRRLSFEDEDFLGFGSKQGFDRAVALAEEILHRNLRFEWSMLTRVDNVDRELFQLLKRAGLSFVFVGAETASQRSLDFYVKETTVEQNHRAVEVLRELDIDHELLWIMYDPETTLEDVEANIEFLEHLDALNVNLLNRLRVYHGTPMHSQLSRRGRLRGNYLEYEYDYADPRVTLFEKHATQGLNAFYQVVNHLDVLKWQTTRQHPLAPALSAVGNRLHLTATIWLGRLLSAVKHGEDLTGFSEEAQAHAATAAQLLARAVGAWRSQQTEFGGEA